MRYLEELDKVDRKDGTTKLQRLRQIPKESGKFISLMAMNAPDGEFIEIVPIGKGLLYVRKI